MAAEFRYLSQEQVIEMGGLDMALAMEDVEEVFRLFSAGECILPNKVVLRWKEAEETRGHINAMPCYVGGKYDMAGLKWVAAMNRNPAEHGLPAVSGLIILNDPTRGIPVAVMDGTLISSIRTGAMSGIAGKHLAREDSKTVGVLGTGINGRTSLMALKTALPALRRVLVYDKNEQRGLEFCEDMAKRLAMSFEVVSTSQEAISQADILVAFTGGGSPTIEPGLMTEGCLVCHMGGGSIELSAMPEFDKIVVDNWPAMQHRGKPVPARAKAEGIISDGDISAELAELIIGVKPGRDDAAECILFSAVGMGTLDVAVATRVLRRAESEQIGTILKLWETPFFS